MICGWLSVVLSLSMGVYGMLWCISCLVSVVLLCVVSVVLSSVCSVV